MFERRFWLIEKEHEATWLTGLIELHPPEDTTAKEADLLMRGFKSEFEHIGYRIEDVSTIDALTLLTEDE